MVRPKMPSASDRVNRARLPSLWASPRKVGPIAAESVDVDWVRACAIGDVSEEIALKVEIEGHPAVAIFQVGEAYYAIADR